MILTSQWQKGLKTCTQAAEKNNNSAAGDLEIPVFFPERIAKKMGGGTQTFSCPVFAVLSAADKILQEKTCKKNGGGHTSNPNPLALKTPWHPASASGRQRDSLCSSITKTLSSALLKRQPGPPILHRRCPRALPDQGQRAWPVGPDRPGERWQRELLEGPAREPATQKA